MGVKLYKCYEIVSCCDKYFERVGDRLVLLNIELKGSSLTFDSRPYHWRYDYSNIPPLDLSLDSETGLLKEITIFLENDKITSSNANKSNGLLNMEGYPSFQTDIWEEDEFYYDEKGQVNLQLNQSELEISILGREFLKKLNVNKELDLLMDKNDVFTGFILKNLNEDVIRYLLETN